MVCSLLLIKVDLIVANIPLISSSSSRSSCNEHTLHRYNATNSEVPTLPQYAACLAEYPTCSETQHACACSSSSRQAWAVVQARAPRP